MFSFCSQGHTHIVYPYQQKAFPTFLREWYRCSIQRGESLGGLTLLRKDVYSFRFVLSGGLCLGVSNTAAFFGSSRFSVGWALLCKDARTESHGFCKHHAHNAYKRTKLTMLTNAPSSPHSPSSPRSPSPRKAHNPASAACNGASNGAAGYAFRHPGVTDARIQTVSERLERLDRLDRPERPESPERLDVQL